MRIYLTKKFITRILDISLPAWTAVCVVYWLIFSTLRNGISCDEGYYLMGYLRNQKNVYLGSDFHNIVRAFGVGLPDDNIMVFRYMRLVLFLCAIVLFSYTSWRWCIQKFESRCGYIHYAPYIFLGGAWCYTFASPTISYDHLQTIFYLFSFSLFFILLKCKKNGRLLVSSALVFFLWLSFANNAPSGVCIIGLIIIWYLSEYNTIQAFDIFGIILGVLCSLVMYHFCVHNLKDFFSQIGNSFIVFFSQKSMSRHDASGLLTSLFKALTAIAEYGAPTFLVSWIVNKKIKVTNVFQYIVIIFVLLFLLFCREFYDIEGVAVLLPLAWMLGFVVSGIKYCSKSASRAFIIQCLILIVLPIVGGFGSNQPLMHKSVMFIPFWIVAFFVLQLRTSVRNLKMEIVLTVLLMAGYVYLGNFSRYHYCYTPRSSNQPLIGITRPQKVLVSAYEQEYYREVGELIHTETGKSKPSYIGFGEHQIAGYLIGGDFNGDLVYHWWQYEFHNEKKPDCFILFKREENDVIEKFSKFPWDFPKNYQRIEMRAMAQNMGDNGLQTIVYIAK